MNNKLNAENERELGIQMQPAHKCTYPHCSYPCMDLPDCVNAEKANKSAAFVGLTNEEIDACWDGLLSAYQRQNIREMEQKLKEKNGGKQ